ncbi:PIG-L deacetylase family protein [Pseudoroseomonas globiformis]|uniref:PIG-L deacetylase family protein n=1 Tax=Teichococcus globiformis TaxID=2307229 RepID=A0ABV7FYA6_9PROT
MMAADYMRAAEALPLVSLDALLPEDGEVLVLAPHPDDEALGCGGLLAALAAAGRPAGVLILSDGAGSHPGSRRVPAPALRSMRAQEAARAVAALGLPAERLRLAGYPDGDVPASGPRLREAVSTILDLRPRTILSPLGLDPHKDHEASWAIAQDAAQCSGARLLAYPVWSWRYLYPEMGPGMPPLPPREWPGPPRGARLDITAFRDTKLRAVGEHRSQTSDLIDDDPDGFRLSEAALAVLQRPFEVYLEPVA